MSGSDVSEPITVYQRTFLDQLPRAMALQDFNPRSRTFGCCDRNYWQYKTLTSFPAGVYQQLALPFAIAFASENFCNPYYHDEQLFDRSIAAVKFWGRSQHRTGAVDEWYRHEFSYCPTAFTAYGMAETLLLLRDEMRSADLKRCLGHVVRSCLWLSERYNPQVMNQNLAACGALWNAYRLTGEAKWERAFLEKWEQTLAHLDPAGWFLEYDGADLGYTTLALDVLAGLHRRGCPHSVLTAAERLCSFLETFVTEDGQLAGRLGSRGTEHTFPFGAHHFAAHVPSAQSLAVRMRRGHAAGTSLVPQSVDDRYFAYFYLPQFGQAATAKLIPAGESESLLQERDVSFASCGFLLQQRAAGSLVTSFRRQGAFNLHSKHRPVHHNFGYWAETAAGERYASCGWNAGEIDLQIGNSGEFTVRGHFTKVADKLPLARGAVPFALLSEWLLCWQPLAERFQKFIKQRKIVNKKAAPLRFRRQLSRQGEALLVHDEIRKETGCPSLLAVGPADDVEVHSPSAKFSGISTRVTISRQTAVLWAERLNQRGILKLLTTYEPDSAGKLTLRSCEIDNESTAAQNDRSSRRNAA